MMKREPREWWFNVYETRVGPLCATRRMADETHGVGFIETVHVREVLPDSEDELAEAKAEVERLREYLQGIGQIVGPWECHGDYRDEWIDEGKLPDKVRELHSERTKLRRKLAESKELFSDTDDDLTACQKDLDAALAEIEALKNPPWPELSKMFVTLSQTAQEEVKRLLRCQAITEEKLEETCAEVERLKDEHHELETACKELQAKLETAWQTVDEQQKH